MGTGICLKMYLIGGLVGVFLVFSPIYGRIKHKGSLSTTPISDPKVKKPSSRQTNPEKASPGPSTGTQSDRDKPLFEKSGICQFHIERGFQTWRLKKLHPTLGNKILALAESQKDRPGQTRGLEIQIDLTNPKNSRILKEIEIKESLFDSEISRLTAQQSKQLQAGGVLAGAWFTANEKNVLFLQDRTGKGFQLFALPLNSTENPHLVFTETLLQDVGVSASKKYLSFTTTQWGLTQQTGTHMDKEGHPIESFPVETNAYESLTAPAYAENNGVKLFSILHSPDKPDAIALVENATIKTVFEQTAPLDCVTQWWRHLIKSKDGTDLMLDIYEPSQTLQNKKWVIHVPKRDTPHTPYFEAHRHYWLQNGWVVVEPHLPKKLDRRWESDIQEIADWANRVLVSTENRKEILWESGLNPTPTSNLEFSRILMRSTQ